MLSSKRHFLISLLPLLIEANFPTTNSGGWRPLKSTKPDFTIGPTPAIKNPGLSIYRPQHHDQCTLHKVAMDQYTYPQYIQYKHKIPDLKQFTLCHWHKFYNHSREQTFFSYSLPHQPKAIVSWISNHDKRSYYMFIINGHTIHRLNYPIKLFHWYHICQSWNGKTGEWQVWVNNERIGRGYYNLLVGHVIKGGGIAVTGQEQHVHGGGFDLLGKSGLQGEITLLQLYKAALTAGKAYINHKHHHVNDYTHDDDPNTVQSRRKRQAIKRDVMNPDMNERVAMNERIAMNDIATSQTHLAQQTDQQTQDSYNSQNTFAHPTFGSLNDQNTDNKLSAFLKQDFIRLLPTYEEQEQFQLGGRVLPQNNQVLPKIPILTQPKITSSSPPTTETEPAEWEVSKILQACSSDCLEDAFRKANVMSWQETPKKLFGGASYPKAAGSCYNF
uniref:Neuronal pentraxin-1 n=1 Tax=Cacopsylla melanoneura TaxID=428564 RepID=A0A8D9E7N0_9HEMI